MDSPDRDDWSEFFALYRALALRVAQGLVGSQESAEDTVQEASQALVEHSRDGTGFEDRVHARNWFLRCVRNLAVNRLRERGRIGPQASVDETLPDTRVADPADVVAMAEAARSMDASVAEAIANLGEDERETLHLRYRDGLPYKEIAARTGTAISTLQARVETALRKIRNRIGKSSGGSNSGHEEH